MFCFVHTDQWSADTGYIGDDEQEIETLNEELKTLIAPEVETIMVKLNGHKKLTNIIKQSIQKQLAINIDVN